MRMHAAYWIALVAGVGCGTEGAARTEAESESAPTLSAPETLISTESGLLGSITDVAVAPDGTVYLVDMQANTIHVVDSTGTRSIGREGAGPGEFMRPASLAIWHDTLGVVDFENGRLQFLTLDGAPLGSVPLAPGPAPGRVGPGWMLLNPTLGMDSALVIVRGVDLRERARIGPREGPRMTMVRMAEAKRMIREGELPPIFQYNAQALAGADGSSWFLLPAKARVARYDSAGALAWSTELQDSAFAEVRRDFVARNESAAANQLFPLRFILDAEVVGEELWLLLGQSALGPASILVLGPDGSEVRRISVPTVEGADRLGVDVERRRLYFVRSEAAELVRVGY